MNDDGGIIYHENTTAEGIASSLSTKICDIQETYSVNADFEEVNRFPKKCPLCHSATKIMLNNPPSNYTSIPKGRRLRYSNDIILAHRLFHTNILYEAELDYNRVVASQV
jgi:tRNA G37 N-methylase Trm5